MIQIIDENRRPSTSQLFGQAFNNLGQAASKALPEFLMRREENTALKKRGIDLGGVYDPHTRAAILSEELRRGTARNQALASIGESEGNGQAMGSSSNGQQMSQVQEAGNSGQGVSSGAGGQASPSSLLTPDQIRRKAGNLVKQSVQLNQPIDYQQALGQVMNDENLKRSELDLVSRYSQIGSEVAGKYFGDEKTNELDSLFQKRGAQFAHEGKTDPEVVEELSKYGSKIKNSISAVQRSLPPARATTKIMNSLLGTGRESEKVINSLRQKLKPLTDEGMYDTARSILANQGYGYEEMETILSNLSEPAKKVMATFPDFKDSFKIPSHFHIPQPARPEEKQSTTSALEEILRKDPSVNLVLLRKAFEDKGIEWNVFKDSLDELIQSDKFALNEDQEKLQSVLDEPPLNNLQKIFHFFDLGGR